MANTALPVGALKKPVKGSAYLAGRDRRADRRDAEQREMQAAMKRDRRRCRWPGCKGKHRGLDLPVDPSHQIHRGFGGNPALDRTTRATVIALCRKCHQRWDAGEIDIMPRTSAGFDGPVAFHARDPESTVMLHVASERAIGILELDDDLGHVALGVGLLEWPPLAVRSVRRRARSC